MRNAPPRPSFALTLGVTGHRLRRDPKPDEPQSESAPLNVAKVSAAVDDFLTTLLSVATELSGAASKWFDPAPPVVALVSSLAEGSDRIAAEAALAHGMPLDVVLPCARPSYEATFADDASRADFADLLGKARARLILPLPGAPDAKREDTMAQAYESAGLTMLAQADILLAIWDGESARGRGGTGEIVDEAARQGAPIVVIDPADGAARLLWSGPGPFALPARRARDLPSGPVDKQALRAIIRGLVLPPDSEHERAGLAMFLATHVPPAGEIGLKPADPKLSPSTGASPGDGRATRRYVEAFDAAGAIAERNARAFRRAFFRNFLIGALATAFIAASIVRQSWHLWFVLAELALTLWVLGATYWAIRQQWHRRWFEAREVAERLRVAETFWMLGVWPHNLTPAQASWTGWYARATLRAQPLFSGDLADLLAEVRATLVALVADQQVYHAGNVEALDKRDRFLEIVGQIFLGLAILNAAAYLVAEFSGWSIPSDMAAAGVAAGVFLPSVAAACYGIRLFGDYEDIVRRSRRTGKALEALQPLLEQDPHDLMTLRARAAQTATAMLCDLEAWRVAVESRYLSAA